MANNQTQSKINIVPNLVALLLGLPWPEVIGDLWRFGLKTVHGLSHEGMYEALDYESTLEIHDSKGKRATFRKYK